jgi:Flp pilus assembly protein TadG
MSLRRNDRGAVTAEFAIVLPAVVLVLALGAGVLGACGRQVRLQDAAADAARLVARGEDEGRAAAVVADAVPGATATIDHRGDLVCVAVSASAGVPLITLTVHADSCALAGGR